MSALPLFSRQCRVYGGRWRQVPGSSGTSSPAMWYVPVPFEDVDDFVVGMAVLRRLPRRDHADELRHVEAARVLVHEVAELAVRRRRQRRLVCVANRHTPRLADTELARGRRHRRRRPSPRPSRSGTTRPERRTPPSTARARARCPSSSSVPVPETTNSTSCRSSAPRSSERPGEKRITCCSRRSQPFEASIVVRTSAVSPGRAHARNVLLRNDEALCDPHPAILATGAPAVNARLGSGRDPAGHGRGRRGGAHALPRVRRRPGRRPLVPGLRCGARGSARVLRARARRGRAAASRCGASTTRRAR